MTNKVYAVIQGYTDDCTYSGEDFDSLELFHNEQDALYRQLELEEEISEFDKKYYYILVRSIKIK